MTMSFNVGATLDTNKSQAVLLAFLIGGCFCLAAGLYFLWHKNNVGYIPLIISICMMAFSAVGWFKSQKDTDLHGSPTVFEDANRGIKFTTDSRFANSQKGSIMLCSAIESTLCRAPLPQASGMIDSLGNPIENSQETADMIVQSVNATAKILADEVGSKFEIQTTSGISDSITSERLPIDSITANNNKLAIQNEN